MTKNEKKIKEAVEIIVFFAMLATIYFQASTIKKLSIEKEPCASLEMIEECIKNKE
jgi:hypothetical protein